MCSSKRRALNWMIVGLVTVASLQTVGHVTGINPLTGIGFVTNASPLPLFFSHFRGREPFSALYTVEWQTKNGAISRARITPENYKKLASPFNLRNVYGAVFAAGPSFQENPVERKLWITMVRRAFCGEGLLNNSLEIPTDLRSIQIIVEGRARGMRETWSKVVTCEQG